MSVLSVLLSYYSHLRVIVSFWAIVVVRFGLLITFRFLGKFTTKVSSIEPNSGIDGYRRNMVSNRH